MSTEAESLDGVMVGVLPGSCLLACPDGVTHWRPYFKDDKGFWIGRRDDGSIVCVHGKDMIPRYAIDPPRRMDGAQIHARFKVALDLVSKLHRELVNQYGEAVDEVKNET